MQYNKMEIQYNKIEQNNKLEHIYKIQNEHTI